MKITVRKHTFDYGFVIEVGGHGIYFSRYEVSREHKSPSIMLYRDDVVVAHVQYSLGLSLALMSVVECGKESETVEQ